MDPQSALGLWLGKSLQSDEHLIGTEQGIRRCRTIWRRPEDKRWDRKLFDNFKGTPWQPRGGPTAVPGAPATPGLPAPGTPAGSNRGVYITLGLQLKHGQTPDCPGCYTTIDKPRPHSKVCRERFEKLVAKKKRTNPEQRAVPQFPNLKQVNPPKEQRVAPQLRAWAAPRLRVRVAPPQKTREAPLPWTHKVVVNPRAAGSREMEGINHLVQIRQRNPAARNKEAKGDHQRLTWKPWSTTRSTLPCWIQSLRSLLDNQHCTKHL